MSKNIRVSTSTNIANHILWNKERYSSEEAVNIKVQSVPEHPFENECKFIVKTERPVEFQFKIRIPFWANEVKINGESIPKRPYVAIEKEFNGKEIIEVEICKN